LPPFSSCTNCRKDDDAAAAQVSTSAVFSAFEKAFCAKLANTGVENFAYVHDCRVRFVAPTAAKEVALQ